MPSEISICNLALMLLAAEPIRSFDENNKRARAVQTAYETQRDILLVRYDWPFASAYRDLQKPVLDDTWSAPDNFTVFMLPNDCLAPREVVPYGNNIQWKVTQNYLLAPIDEVKLRYTKKIEDPFTFSPSFIGALAQLIAFSTCNIITRDNTFCAQLRKETWAIVEDYFVNDANIGNEYKRLDDIYENDTFTDPDLKNA